ncbi:MAG: polyphosphate:AMP phosphotransferase [Deferribacteraceae bacterium]|jgi:polyphosphate:AMP phosphotransferase|nr:polyphosphate:AMP phosphotransferase [Deferribacteraceae bacterium]
MFELAEQSVSIDKNEYNRRLNELRTTLFNTQLKLIEEKIPVLILIDGMPGAGRGELINLLNEWMDSKHIKNRTFWKLSGETKQKPEYWRYWNVIPARSEIGLFFGGWYQAAAKRFLNGKSSEIQFEKEMNTAVRFEKTLSEDGMLIIKLWLHLSGDNYHKILKKRGGKTDPLSGDKHNSRISCSNILKAYEKAIRITDTAAARWYIIDSHNANQRNIAVLELLISVISNAIKQKKDKQQEAQSELVSPLPEHVLSKVNLDQKIEGDYNKLLKKYKEAINCLTLKAYEKGISTVILFEGWDAAGKGGAIRRLTSAIDARIRQTIQIAAPTDEERARHYLWRFWRHIPQAGHVTIYDRSWYGRVLVERVEKLASVAEFSRAFEEINHFESQLVEGGCLLIKFWMHISQDEQLRRFKQREELEWKNYKITSEDWRNREKAEDYFAATDDMLVRTSTEIAPWRIIPANDKHYARIEIMRIVCNELKRVLKTKR